MGLIIFYKKKDISQPCNSEQLFANKYVPLTDEDVQVLQSLGYTVLSKYGRRVKNHIQRGPL